MEKKQLAQLGMVTVTLLWAACYVTGKMAMDQGMTPNVYTAFRFCGASIVLGLMFFKRLLKANRETIKIGVVIGIAVGLGYVIQTIGLNMTTASKAGFLTGLYVVLVPIFDCIIKRIYPKFNETIGVTLATIGLAVLSLNADFSMGLGDVLVFLGAVCFAVSIVIIGRYAGTHDPLVLSVLQIFVTGLMGLMMALITEPVPAAELFDGKMIGIILFVIFFGSAVNTTVQNVAQSLISPTAAALILVLEPVFSGVFGYLFLHEPLGLKELLGSGLIVTGMLITLLYKPKKAGYFIKKRHRPSL